MSNLITDLLYIQIWATELIFSQNLSIHDAVAPTALLFRHHCVCEGYHCLALKNLNVSVQPCWR